MDAAGQSSAAKSRTSEQGSRLESQQSEHEQQRRGIGSSDGAHANFTPPERLGIDNTNVERGIRSIPNLSPIQSHFPRPTTVANFGDLMSGPRVSQGHTSVQGSSHWSVDTLQQRSSAVQLTHPWGDPFHLPSPWGDPFHLPSPWGDPFHLPSPWGDPFHLPSPWEDPFHLPSSGKLNISVAPSQSAQPPQSSNQMTAERTRKRSKNNNETNGCKRCNCKKSKCLKLYCECFSAGMYCTDSLCSCTCCLNNTDYEDTVMEFRKQIEFRDPHAFAPKVKQGNGFPANTMQKELNQTTPLLERHRRGCNCRKSKCVKKYCECYQAGVGCSERCRCENCTNPFGRKAIAGVKH